MIGKITGGASFGGCLDYLTKPKEPKRAEEKELYRERLKEAEHTPGEPAPPFEAGERHRVIGGNMSGQTKGELRREFKAIRRQRPDIEKPVHHASLSAGERDKVTVERWNEIAARYVREMGFKDAPYVVIQHRDGKTDHVHVLTSRVDMNGRVVSDWQCKERAEVVLRDIEREYGLEQVKSSREVERAAPKRGEIERFNRTGELSAKMSMQSHVELALKDGPTATEFIERLQLSGIEAIPYIDKSGRTTGISFRKGKELMKGSDLGRGFSWNALQARGLDYQPERDRPALEAARERATLTRAEAGTTPAPELSRELSQPPLAPVHQVGIQTPALQQPGMEMTDGVTALRDLVTKQGGIEQLSHSVGVDAGGKDALERLQQAVGIETGKDDALERLGRAAGLEPKDPSTELNPTLDKALEHAPELTPALEPAEERTIEMAIDFTR